VGAELQEIEGKFIDIDTAQLTRKIEELGGKKRFSKLFRRYVFDYPDRRLNGQAAWLRLRDEGDKVTMTFKQRQQVNAGQPDGGMREIEVEVSDFERTAELVRAIGLEPKFYEENRRTLYTLDGAELCIDEWPLIPPYLEIEARSWDMVDGLAKKLGFDPSEKMVCSTMQVYEHYGINENDYRVLTFDRQLKTRTL
jgi:adenylate cyclase, class 2